MKGTVSKVSVHKDVAKSEARWPLSFRIVPPPKQGLEAVGISITTAKPKKRWWSHLLYRGPNDERVKVLYSRTKAHSEVLARQFLQEKVVGFDMEWPWDDWKRPNKLQNKIGLIQVATEDKIALFHIGLHVGNTTDDIIAPSLRKLIESPAIGKIGVGIFKADFNRLSRYFKLKPKGAVELSHLHRLVTFGGHKPELVSTKMTSLAHQVEQHLGHPLYKGDVRTSHWSRPLSQEQINYAAGDAYAGIMLYHCLNYKRLQMDPVPPMPIHAEKYMQDNFATISSLYLEPLEEGGKVMTSAFFFGVPTAPEDLSKSKSKSKSKSESKSQKATVACIAESKAAIPTPIETVNTLSTSGTVTQSKTRQPAAKPTTLTSLDSWSQAVYHDLVEWRRGIAAQTKLPHYRILYDQTLIKLAAECPVSSSALLKIVGIGPKKEQLYGKQILEVISRHMAKNSIATPERVVDASDDSVKKQDDRAETPDSSPAFGTPPPGLAPQQHSGLSFALEEWKLGRPTEPDDMLSWLDSDQPRRTSAQKRKRIESGTKQKPEDPQRKKQNKETDSKPPSPEPSHENRSPKQVLPRNPRQSSPPQPTPTVHLLSTAKPHTTFHPSTTAHPSPPTPQTHPPTASPPLTPRTKILHNKLLAYSKLVARKTHRQADTLMSAATVEGIARKPPRTREELCGVCGVQGILEASEVMGRDFFEVLRRFVGAG